MFLIQGYQYTLNRDVLPTLTAGCIARAFNLTIFIESAAKLDKLNLSVLGQLFLLYQFE